MNKNPMGFSGGGFWAIIALLVLGVGWVENRFGTTIAGYAVIAVGGALFLIVGFLLCVAAMQSFGNLMVGIEKARSRINLYHAKTETIRQKGENEFQKQVMREAMFIGRALGASYKAQIQAEQQMATPPAEQPIQIDPYVIGLNRDQYQFSDDDG